MDEQTKGSILYLVLQHLLEGRDTSENLIGLCRLAGKAASAAVESMEVDNECGDKMQDVSAHVMAAEAIERLDKRSTYIMPVPRPKTPQEANPRGGLCKLRVGDGALDGWSMTFGASAMGGNYATLTTPEGTRLLVHERNDNSSLEEALYKFAEHIFMQHLPKEDRP